MKHGVHKTRLGYVAPSFLGVGPPKCGTTWLDAALRTNPRVFLPRYQKEVFYFSRYFSRGNDWYTSLFAGAEQASAAGEISTNYILERTSLQRIRDFNPDVKVIVILREPARRLLSHHGMLVETGQASDELRETTRRKPWLVRYSRYAELMPRLMEFFPAENVHIAIFEEVFRSRESQSSYLQELGGFIGLQSEELRFDVPRGPVRRARGAPRSAWLTKTAKRLRRILVDADAAWAVNAAERIGVNRDLFSKPFTESQRTSVKDDEVRYFEDLFAPDRRAVEALLGRVIEAWR